VRQDHPGVRVRRQEHLEELAEEVLPEESVWGVDLDEAEYQHVGAGLAGEGQQLRHLQGVAVVGEVEQGLDQVQAPPGRDLLVVEVWLDLKDLCGGS